MRILFRKKAQAEAALKRSGKTGRKGVADCNAIEEIADTHLQLGGVAGEVQCFRTDDGDIFAWWEL